MTPPTFRGSCLCGSVQYEISGEPQRFNHCHCSRCRKATGTGHASNLLIKPGSIKWIKGEELIRAYKIPEAKRFTSRFCTVCGSQAPRYVKETDFFVIPAGSLDSDPTTWRDLSWSDVAASKDVLAALRYLPLAAARGDGSVPSVDSNAAAVWAASSADMASIARRLPFELVIHGRVWFDQ